VARVLLQPGSGNIIVNGMPYEQRFPRGSHQAAITLPLRLTNRLGSLNVLAKVLGGGVSGQAGAIVHATARALLKADEANKQVLREAGLLTRDAREKERKKYGLKKARKAPQYTKR
jgi:small subunit ribosomal protein S9